MEQPKICHVTTGHNPTDDRIFYKECISLAKNYSTVSIIAPDRETITKKHNVTFYYFEEKTYFKNLKSAYQLAKKVDADIYHIHEFELLPLFIWLKLWYNKKIIYDGHESVYDYFLDFSKRKKWMIWPIAIVAQAIESFFSIFVNHIISVTPQVANKFKYLNSGVDIIYNFPQLYHFDQYEEKKTNDPLIIFPGHISKTRNIEVMIDAMIKVVEIFPNARLLLIGNADDQYRAEISNRIQINNLKTNVMVKSAVPYHKIPKIMKSAHIGLSSMGINNNLKKAIQIKDFEYMYCKLPVIAAKVSSTEFFVGNNKAGIVLQTVTAESLSKAIIKLLSSPELAAQYGDNGYHAVKENYNWKIMEKKLYRIYEKVITQ